MQFNAMSSPKSQVLQKSMYFKVLYFRPISRELIDSSVVSLFVVWLFTLGELRGEHISCQLGVMVANEQQEIAETWHRIHNKNKLRGIEIS